MAKRVGRGESGRRPGFRGVLLKAAVGAAVLAVAWPEARAAQGAAATQASAEEAGGDLARAADRVIRPFSARMSISRRDAFRIKQILVAQARLCGREGNRRRRARPPDFLRREYFKDALQFFRIQSGALQLYEEELQRNPNLSGKVTTQFVIGPTGAVISARVASSTMADAGVEACLVKVVKQIRFPPCGGGGTSTRTFTAGGPTSAIRPRRWSLLAR